MTKLWSLLAQAGQPAQYLYKAGEEYGRFATFRDLCSRDLCSRDLCRKKPYFVTLGGGYPKS